jgi:hypothetical protein
MMFYNIHESFFMRTQTSRIRHLIHIYRSQTLTVATVKTNDNLLYTDFLKV